MRQLMAVIFTLWVGLLGPGCADSHRSVASDDRLLVGDVDALTGAPWVGTLTYLDYKTHRHTTIDSSLTVRRTADTPPTWQLGTGYSKEPHADSTSSVSLTADGRMFGDERVISRTQLAGGGVAFVTEVDGNDDDRPARFRFEHTITATEYSRRKLVRFEGESEFFERHIYRWSRGAATSPSGIAP